MPNQLATIDALLAELHEKQSVLQGWTAALSLSEAAVHNLLQRQWAAQPKLALAWAQAVEAGGKERPAAMAQLNLELDAPQFRLPGEGNVVAIRQSVRCATLKQGTLRVVGPAGPADIRCDPDNPQVAWAEPQPMGLSAEACLEGSVPLSVVDHETIPNTRVVTLNLGAATFALRGLATAAVGNVSLAGRLGAAVAGSQPRLELASLDLSQGAKSSAWKAVSLTVNVARSKSGNHSLQLLIGGEGGPPARPQIAVDEPVPTESGADYSLLLGSQVVLPSIVTDFNMQPGLVKLVVVAPATMDASVAAYAQTRNPMQYQGSITCGTVFPAVKSQATMGMNFKGSASDGLVLSGYVDPTSNINLQFTMAGNFPVAVSGAGRDQRVSLTSGTTSFTATGVAENAVKPQLETFLSEISRDLGKVTLDPATDLLLHRLSLPGHLPKIVHAQIPGDLVLAGTLERQGAQ